MNALILLYASVRKNALSCASMTLEEVRPGETVLAFLLRRLRRAGLPILVAPYEFGRGPLREGEIPPALASIAREAGATVRAGFDEAAFRRGWAEGFRTYEDLLGPDQDAIVALHEWNAAADGEEILRTLDRMERDGADHLCPPLAGMDVSSAFYVYRRGLMEALRTRSEAEIPALLTAADSPFRRGALPSPPAVSLGYAFAPRSLPSFVRMRAILKHAPSGVLSRTDLEALVAGCPTLLAQIDAVHAGIEATTRRDDDARHLPVVPRSGDIPLEVVERLAAFDDGPLEIDLWGVGEPLLHPRFRDVIDRLCARENVRVSVYSDGVNLSPDMQAFLLDRPIDAIVVSLDAAAAETYKAVHGRDRFDLVVNQLEAFERLKAARIDRLPRSPDGRRHPLLGVDFHILPENQSDTDAFFDRWDRASAYAKPGRVPDWEAFYRDGHAIEHATLRSANGFAGAAAVEKVHDFTPLRRSPCRQVMDGPYILVDGRVVKCRQDIAGADPIGLLPADDLSAILRSAAYARRIDEQITRRWDEVRPCASCREWHNSWR